MVHFEVLIEDQSGSMALEVILEKILSANAAVLDNYVQDSICGTWEILADAIYPGGVSRLKSLGYREAGEAKRQWAEEIAPRMNVDRNQSVSFRVFRDGLRALARIK